ncbi:redox-sensitive bicupin YhaK (pirin superfamily) [Streptacidiphilus sp. MAP12-16]
MSTTQTPLVDVRRTGDRSEARLSWLHGRHSFWVGGQPYDPGNTHHGLLLVHNEDVIQPGTGFETHPHQDMEIVTWVLECIRTRPATAASSTRASLSG